MEPWTFVVVKDKSLKATIQEIVEEEEKLNLCQENGRKVGEGSGVCEDNLV